MGLPPLQASRVGQVVGNKQSGGVWKLLAPQSSPPPITNSSQRQILIGGVTASSCHYSIFNKNLA